MRKKKPIRRLLILTGPKESRDKFQKLFPKYKKVKKTKKELTSIHFFESLLDFTEEVIVRKDKKRGYYLSLFLRSLDVTTGEELIEESLEIYEDYVIKNLKKAWGYFLSLALVKQVKITGANKKIQKILDDTKTSILENGVEFENKTYIIKRYKEFFKWPTKKVDPLKLINGLSNKYASSSPEFLIMRNIFLEEQKKLKEQIKKLKSKKLNPRLVLTKFEKLINTKDIKEDKIQEFLEKYPWVFGPKYLEFKPHQREDSKILDFLTKKTDDSYEVVEVESPNYNLFVGKYQRNSKELSEAIAQIRDYQEYYLKHYDYVYSQKNVKVFIPAGLIVIGRKKDTETDRLKLENTNQNSLRIITYDELLTDANQLLNIIEKFKF